MKFLIVDDDILSLEALDFLIKDYFNAIEKDVVIDKATDGKEALQKAKNENYTCIFMDVLMPQMDGFEATRKIRLLDIKQPLIIMITALDDQESIKKGFLNGANWYFTKPYNPDILAVLLNDIITQKLYLSFQKESIVKKKLSAKEFMQNFIMEFSAHKLEILLEDMLELVNEFAKDYNVEILKNLAVKFYEFAEYIKHSGEFDKIAYAMFEISDILKKHIYEFDEEFFIDFIYSVLEDMNKWVDNIFISQSAIDIHYLDDSLLSSISQLKSIFEKEEIEMDVMFFD
jgi:DNA-binding response OmpR family regulator